MRMSRSRFSLWILSILVSLLTCVWLGSHRWYLGFGNQSTYIVIINEGDIIIRWHPRPQPDPSNLRDVGVKQSIHIANTWYPWFRILIRPVALDLLVPDRAVIVAIAALALVIRQASRHRPKFGQCAACSYDVQHLQSDRCPECGWPLCEQTLVSIKNTRASSYVRGVYVCGIVLFAVLMLLVVFLNGSSNLTDYILASSSVLASPLFFFFALPLGTPSPITALLLSLIAVLIGIKLLPSVGSRWRSLPIHIIIVGSWVLLGILSSVCILMDRQVLIPS